MAQTTPSTPSLEIAAPNKVEVGEPIDLKLRLKGASNLAGYEVALLFDTGAAHFNGLQQRKNDLKQLKRDIGPLGPLELTNGVAFGLYSCPVDDCVQHNRGSRQKRGGDGAIKLATATIVADKAGTLQIAVSAPKFVAPDGSVLAVALESSLINIQVGQRGAGPLYSAPASTWSLPQTAGAQKASPDVTGDGLVTNADAATLGLEWRGAREQGIACGNQIMPQYDLNKDGCLDVADLQSTVASYSTASLSSSSTTNAIGAASTESTSNEVTAAGLTFTVNSNADTEDTANGDGVCRTAAGVCTLRAAITEANLTAGADNIVFNIPGSGTQTITLGKALPILSDETGPIRIDGYTQPGAAPNTHASVSNAVIRVQLAGTTSFDAFRITSANNMVRGLALYGLKRSFLVYGSGAHHNTIVGNFIGTDAAGNFTAPTFVGGSPGVVLAEGASYTQIGNTAPADRNIISGNAHNGITTYDETTDHNVIFNNIIGLAPNGTRNLRNKSHGIDINGHSSYNIIGGTEPGQRNVVSGNSSGEGIELSHGTLTTNNRVIGNFVGTDVSGTSSPSYAYNGYHGLHIEDGATNNVLAYNVVGGNGGSCCGKGGIGVEGFYTMGNQVYGNRVGVSTNNTPIPNTNYGISVRYHAMRNIIGPNNIIAYNPVGIQVEDPDNDFNTLTANQVYANTGLGIDLQPLGAVNQNDGGDADSGANEQLNFPLLQSATSDSVAGASCAGCKIEIYASDSGAGAYGEGRRLVGSATAGSDGSFVAAVSGIGVGEYVTATATDSDGNTSEFSLNLQVSNDATQVYAQDSFGRSVTNGWGNAQIGGPYSLSGTAADFKVDGSSGTISMSAAGATRAAYLANVSARDVDASVRWQSDKTAQGGSQFVYIVLRRNSSGEYRAKLRLATDGSVWVQASRVSGGAETGIGSEVRVAGLTHSANAPIRLRAQVVDGNPTTLRIRAWSDGQAEPATWAYSATDSTAALQTAGSVGLRAYLGSTSNNTPVLFSFDDFRIVNSGGSSTTPTPTPTPAPQDPQLRAADSFSRSVSNSWGSAETGGVYAHTAPLSAFEVSGGVGTVTITETNKARSAYLTNVAALNVDSTFRVKADKLPAGGYANIQFVARRVSGGSEYRGRVRFTPSGAVYVQASKVINNVETFLGTQVRATNVTQQANAWLRVRAQISGSNPTTLRFKVWPDGQAEPSEWTCSVTDTQASLQSEGSVGIRTYLSTGTTALPTVFSYDDLRVYEME